MFICLLALVWSLLSEYDNSQDGLAHSGKSSLQYVLTGLEYLKCYSGYCVSLNRLCCMKSLEKSQWMRLWRMLLFMDLQRAHSLPGREEFLFHIGRTYSLSLLQINLQKNGGFTNAEITLILLTSRWQTWATIQNCNAVKQLDLLCVISSCGTTSPAFKMIFLFILWKWHNPSQVWIYVNIVNNNEIDHFYCFYNYCLVNADMWLVVG